ncbi:MAG TPA: TolC family protein [Thermoanaerobaculia bacterium]|nr:TolC family protein [Thermoanaerobaculia bacterium]
MFVRNFVFAAIAIAPVFANAQTGRDLTLDEAIALARRTSENVAIARAGVERAAANVQRTESQRLPQINGSFSYQRTLASQFQGLSGGGNQAAPDPVCTEPLDPNLPLEQRVAAIEKRLQCPPASALGGFNFSNIGFGAPNTWNAGLSFNWALFSFGRDKEQVRASEAQRTIANQNLTATEAQARLEVTQAYFDAQLAAALVDIGQDTVTNAEETLRLTTLRANEGAQAEFDVLQARVTRDNLRPNLIRRQAQHRLAFDRLRTLINVPLDETLRLTTPVTAAAGRVVRETIDVDERIPVREMRERLHAAQRLLTAARLERYPNISVSSQAGLVSFSERFLPQDWRKNWTVGAALAIPIYDGGRIRADIASARADLAEAEATLRQITEFAQLDTESALADLRAARSSYEATEGTVEQAQRGYELARLRYREGVSIALEIANARVLLEQARVNRAQAARDLWVTQTRVELLPLLPIANAPTMPQPQQPYVPTPQPQSMPVPVMTFTGVPPQ